MISAKVQCNRIIKYSVWKLCWYVWNVFKMSMIYWGNYLRRISNALEILYCRSMEILAADNLSQSPIEMVAPSNKGAGTLLHVLHVCYSFHQKCSKLGTHTTQGLKNNFYLRCFSISSGPEPRITDEYLQFFQFFN
jgi:hypothetical protein